MNKKYIFFRYKKLKIFLILNIAFVGVVMGNWYTRMVPRDYIYLSNYYSNSAKVPEGVAYIEPPVYSTKYTDAASVLKAQTKSYMAHSKK